MSLGPDPRIDATEGRQAEQAEIDEMVDRAEMAYTAVLACILAERLCEHLKVTIEAADRPGGTALVSSEAVARTEPYGHTMRLAAATSFTVLPNLSYDLNANFEIAAGVADTIAIMEMKEG